MDLGTALVTGASAAALASAIYGGWQFSAARYRETLGSRSDLKRRLNELALGATSQYIEGRFGAPIFRLDLAPDLGYVVHLYRTRHAWLVLWYGKDATVQVISVTVTDPKFRYPTSWLTFDQLKVVLGHSTFFQVPEDASPIGSRLEIGARRGEYVELYSFGNPGQYASYYLSYNDAGCGKFDAEPSHRGGLSHWAGGELPPFGTSKESPPADLASFRAGTTINTLTIVVSGLDPAHVARSYVGVNLDMVRMLRT